jgi:drug/metabolite transporter (DMT)-like permease
VLLGVLAAATWGAYSMLVAPLMKRASATRISAIVLGLGCIPLLLVSSPQLAAQDWSLPPRIWLLLGFATFGVLVLTSFLWFHSLDRIGPARATLATNLQPFLAALFAVVLLGEPIDPLLVAGGVLIAFGLVLARGRRRPIVPAD